MRRGFPYETRITCKKEGKISVEGRILRSVTMSRDTGLLSPPIWNHPVYYNQSISIIAAARGGLLVAQDPQAHSRHD